MEISPSQQAFDDKVIAYLADGIVRIEYNYARETSRPGSRFAGKRLEIVQVEWILKQLRNIGWMSHET